MLISPDAPIRDVERLRALRATGLLEAGRVGVLDRLTRLAARVLDAPTALVSLVGADHQRFPGAYGLTGELAEKRETPLSHSFCKYVVAAGDPLVVPDARVDPRLDAHPAIADYDVVAYAGVPLRTPDGHVLGSVCVADCTPRDWTEQDLEVLRDLADAAQTEVALRLARAEQIAYAARTDAEHAFLEAVLDSLEVGVAACDSEGRLMFLNRAARDLSGRESAPHTPMSEWGTLHPVYEPDGRRIVENLPLRRAFQGEIVQGQQLLIKARGTWQRLLSNGRPIETQDGERLGAVVALHDITEAYRAEELRRARHAVAQVLSDATNAKDAGIGAVAAITESLGWLCGEYWQVTEDREAIVRHSSYTTGDRDLSAFTSDAPLTFVRGEGLPGLVWHRNSASWWDTATMPGDMVDAGRAALHDVGIRVAVGVPVRSGRRTLGVLAFYTDHDLPYDTDTVEMLDAVGAHLGRFVERRWAEDMSLALADARRSFDRIVAQVNDYVWTVEAVPGELPCLVYGSPNAAGVFGQAVTPEAPATLTERVHPDDAELMMGFHADLADGEHAELECRVVGFDGVVRWIWTRAVPRWEGDRLFIDGLSTDVTERHELSERRERLLEQEREQVEQLRELDRMKDELSAVVIHELRNPVSVIKAYTEVLLDSPGLGGAERKHATVVDRTTRHLQGLVDDLLDLARLDAGHVSIDPCPMAADTMLCEVVDSHRPSADAKSLTLHATIKPGLAVHADAQRLRQALDNLLSNAVKYTPEGGTVRVTAEHHGADVVVTISDNGIGIPAEQYPHLFSRFFRASNATRAGIKGTGLGLAVTKAILDAHGGTLSARPARHGGTEFTLTLPAPELDFDAPQR
ncbi:ATP-binding protein [Actinoplanes sp. URMC 104]|uniref:sensor histidine kinase n=1 Tax=Actinoplanes sp. URMC 104 TaxID=3423409 RepID=UPI003F1BA945